MRTTSGDLKSFLFLAEATVAPLVPVVVLTTPVDTLVKAVGGALF